MSRIGRYALGALTLLSLFLFLATAAAWAYASGQAGSVDYVWSSPSRQCHVDLRLRGDIFLHVSRRSARVVGSHVVLRHVEVPGLWYDHELLNNAPAGSVDWGVVNLKYWLACSVFALLPASRGGIAGVRRVRRRPPPGACASCGYDLRATPQRCPECGAVPKGEGPNGRQTARD